MAKYKACNLKTFASQVQGLRNNLDKRAREGLKLGLYFSDEPNLATAIYMIL